MTTAELSILSPVTLATFFESYWEQQPLYIERSAAAFSYLFDFSSFETLLGTQPLYFPGLQLTQSGKTIDVGSYTDDQSAIIPSRLFEYHAEGASVVLSQAQKLFPPLAQLCREVVRTLNMRCQTNVYISPAGNKGFNAHYDSHDVFILQVSGAKTFNFYPSTVELPFPEEQFDPSRLQPSPIDESIALSAGDTLYIPRGVVHDAIADETAPSVHVTLGVYPMLLRDVLIESVQRLAQQDSLFRQSVSRFQHRATTEITGSGSHDALKDELQGFARQLQEMVANDDDLDHVLGSHYDELALDIAGDYMGRFSSAKREAQSEGLLQGKTRLTLKERTVINHERRADGLKVRTFGQILEFTQPVSDVVERLIRQGYLESDDVSSLPREQWDAMVSSLAKADLIVHD